MRGVDLRSDWYCPGEIGGSRLLLQIMVEVGAAWWEQPWPVWEVVCG